MIDRLEPLKRMIVEGALEAIAETEKMLSAGVSGREILDEALLPGMEEVGRRMKLGEAFIPEVLLSAGIMQDCLDVVRPSLEAGDSGTVAKMVIGTVEGDMHDIGKNLVAMLVSGAGFEVVNLGKGVTADKFVAAVREHDPDVLGMSGLLTTTIPHMSETIGALKSAGLRDQVKVIVGGAPVTEAFAKEIGADAYGANGSLAVDKCKELTGAVVR